MNTVNSNTRSTLPEPVRKVVGSFESLGQEELQTLLAYVKHLLERKENLTEHRERELIHRIKNGGPVEAFWEQYGQFRRKSEADSLSESERREYLHMIERSRWWDVERMQLVKELSELQRKSFQETWVSLNVEPRSF